SIATHQLPTIDMATPTPEELQQQIAALTTALDTVVTQFVRPAAQQSLENQQSIAQLISLLDRHAQAMVGIDERLDRVAQQQEANTEAIAAAIERMTAFDGRLEETRQLVAQNASNAAQNEARHSAAMDRIDAQQQRLGEEVQAIAEATRTQLTAIIGNGRRIDRLEQQAS
ncbi:MAG: hypothetical protein AAFY15_02820, partial [Cyanobacteria bacterium J06648_11]